MTVFRNNDMWDSSNVEFEGGQILAYSKTNKTSRMHYIDYGLGAFRAAAFDSVPAGSPSISPACMAICCRAGSSQDAK